MRRRLDERTDHQRRRDRLAFYVMAALLAAMTCVMPMAGWHSAEGVDSRTQIEMIKGVADHGLPYTVNGDSSRFPALRARWNVAQGERLWGMYPPLLAYLGAPFFRLGGVAAVSRMNIAVLILFTLGMYFTAARFFRDRLLGVAAAYLAVLSTPIPATALDMSPYIHADAFLVWSAYLAVVSVDQRAVRSDLCAIAAGVLSALSIASHLLTFVMVLGFLVAIITIGNSDETGPFTGNRTEDGSWWPTHASVRRFTAMTVGLVAGLLPVSILNHVRFDSFSPITYGPCVWRSCGESGTENQHITDMVAYAAPTFGILVFVGLTFWLLRSRIWLAVASVVVGLLVMLAASSVRAHALKLALVTWGTIFDVSRLDFGPPFFTPPDGTGHFLGPWVIRSLLQCSPIFFLAVFAKGATARERSLLKIFTISTVFLLGSLILRANQPTAFALGFPLLFLRYTTPGCAMLSLLAVSALRDLPWGRVSGALVLGLTLVIALALLPNDDASFVRRVFLLYGSLLLGSVAFVAVSAARRFSTPLWKTLAVVSAAVCIAVGTGSNLGLTLPAAAKIRDANDFRADAIMKVVPDHAAVFGYARELDAPLGALVTRGVVYADLYEQGSNVPELVDAWTAQGRPVYALLPWDADIRPAWPELSAENVLASENLFRVRRRPQ